jgi:ABC-type uncharacterized transport system ATPase subunit
MTETNMIISKELTKIYGRGSKQIEAVRSTDLQVRQGEIFGLVGPDGAGKTTTIQMLCGILTPTAGTAGVRVDTYPDRVFEGTVLQVADEAEFTPSNIQTKNDRVRLVYAVTLSLDNADLALKPGMIADATFGE